MASDWFLARTMPCKGLKAARSGTEPSMVALSTLPSSPIIITALIRTTSAKWPLVILVISSKTSWFT